MEGCKHKRQILGTQARDLVLTNVDILYQAESRQTTSRLRQLQRNVDAYGIGHHSNLAALFLSAKPTGLM